MSEHEVRFERLVDATVEEAFQAWNDADAHVDDGVFEVVDPPTGDVDVVDPAGSSGSPTSPSSAKRRVWALVWPARRRSS